MFWNNALEIFLGMISRSKRSRYVASIIVRGMPNAHGYCLSNLRMNCQSILFSSFKMCVASAKSIREKDPW